MTEWRESLTHSVSAPSTVEPMPQLENPGIRRGKTPFSSCKKRPIADCSKSYRSLTTIVKTAKKSTSSTTGQMKGCIRHVILVFNSKTPIPYWASAAHEVSNTYTEHGTFNFDVDLPVKVMSIEALPKRMLYWYIKFTLKPTRHMARFTVSNNIKGAPSTVCHSQRCTVIPVFSYLKHQVDKTPFCQRNPHFDGLKKISAAFVLPIKLSLCQLTSSLTFPIVGEGGAERAAAWGLVPAGLIQNTRFWHPAWAWKGLR